MNTLVKENSVLEMKNIYKSFPGVKTLQAVDFTLCEGEIHALMGENGAGKSTLIKVLTGVYEKDGGDIFLKEHEGAVAIRSQQDAQNLGISTVYQEITLCPNLSTSDGIDLRSERQQVGARLSLNHTGKSDLYNVILNVAPRTVKYQDADYDTFRSALLINPTIPVMDPEQPGKYTQITTYSTNNPVEILKLEKSGGERTILSWDGTFKLNLFPLLCRDKNHYLSTQITLAQQIIETDYSWFRPSISTIEDKSGFQGEASRKYDKNKQESLEWLVNYGYDTGNHHVKFMGGYSYQYFVNDGLNAENKNFASDLLGPDNLGAGTYNSEVEGRLGMGSYRNDSKLIAFFGRLSYNFRDKYFATFSLRHEGSSKFGVSNKWGSFPAVSAGWRISEEDFIKNIQWISDLKLRGDFGVTGNQEFDSYKSLALMQAYDLIYYNGTYIKGWGFSSNANPNLKWEKGKNWNVGIDFSLFNYRLNGSVNYYSRKQQDLLGVYDVALPPNGASQSFVNVGTRENYSSNNT